MTCKSMPVRINLTLLFAACSCASAQSAFLYDRQLLLLGTLSYRPRGPLVNSIGQQMRQPHMVSHRSLSSTGPIGTVEPH